MEFRLKDYNSSINSQLMPEGESFGKKLARWRSLRGMNQAELARRLEVSPTYISNLERDFSPSARSGTPKPSVEFIDRVSSVLGVPNDEARLSAGYAPRRRSPENDKEFKLSLYYRLYELREESNDPKQIEIIDAVIKGLINQIESRQVKKNNNRQ